MMLAKALASASASAAKVYVEDVFSTWLYTGNGSTQTITNGIDLSGKGGLVWIKGRSGATGHRFTDTARGATKSLASNSTAAETTESTGLTSFSSTGFSIGDDADYSTSAATYVSWTFRKAAKFFDVVTWSGDDVMDRKVNHALGSTPGCVIVKATNATGSWYTWHRSAGHTKILFLNTTAAGANIGMFNVVDPTSTQLNLHTNINTSGETYVAYLFAHDAGGFGDSGNDSIISCGSSTSSSKITLGWEPQFVLYKCSNVGNNDWFLFDNMRGMLADTSSNSRVVYPNKSVAEEDYSGWISVDSTGFNLNGNAGETYIYIAIRRGPMKTPTDATKVFESKVYTGTNVDNRLVTTDILTDMTWVRQRNDTVLGGMVVGDRMRGQPYLLTGSTAGEVDDADSFDREIVSVTEYGTAFSSMIGFWVGNDATSKLNVNTTSNNHSTLAFRRAPGFFDVVAYTGTGANRTVSHNLGVAPELMIVKKRSAADAWIVYANNDNTDYLVLNTTAATVDDNTIWNDTSPTSSVFTVGTNDDVNGNTATFIAYLFASCPGVSKVGSYTGSSNDINVDCGFTNGARFVLIKRVNDTGSWFVWDTARGITSGNDPYLLLNSTAAEVTNTDYLDPYSAGFTVPGTNVSPGVNNPGDTFIFLAIA